MDDIVIVGGGIIGTSAAYFLSKEGRKVKVIEEILHIKKHLSLYHSEVLEDNFFKEKIFY